MSNQKLVPRNDNEGSLGTPTKRWGDAHFTSASIDNLTATIIDQDYAGDFEGTFTGSVSGSFIGDLEGTAATASYVEFGNVDDLTGYSSSIANEQDTQDSRLGNLETASGSIRSDFTSTSASISVEQDVQDSRLNSLEIESGSIRSDFTDFTSSYDTGSFTGSFAGTTAFDDLIVNGNGNINGNLTVTGRITAEEYYTEYVSSSIIYSSGSTQFGDSIDDTHQFTGSIDVEGSITGAFEGDFSGDGADLLNVRSVQHRVNSITVNQKTDFPAPTGSIITLEENTEYFINGLVNIGTDQIYYNTGSYIGGLNINADQIYYSGTDAAINSNNVGQIVGKNFSIIAPSGSAIDLRQDDNVVQVNYDYIGFVGCKNIGTIYGYDVVTLNSCARVPIIGVPQSTVSSGLRISGPSNKVFIDSCVFQDVSGSDYSIYFDETFDTSIVDISNTYFKSDQFTSIEVHPSASIGDGRLLNNAFVGIKDNGPTTGIAASSIGWEFIANTALLDTRVGDHYYIPETETPVATTINTTGTPVKVSATTVSNPISQKFSHSGDNRSTYLGNRPIIVDINATLSLSSLSNNETMKVYTYINGILVEGSGMPVRLATAGDPYTVSSLCQTSLQPGDFVEIWISNETSTADVTIESLSVVIQK